MSDAHQSEELLDHGHRIAQLELKVAELERRLGEADSAPGAGDSASDAGLTFASDQRSPGVLDHPHMAELLAAGNKIGAIKLYRELTGSGLKEAKNAVEELEG